MPEKRITVTEDDADRLDGIAGELEHLPAEIRRHFDQDGRDARYLRIIEKRIRAALASSTGPDPENSSGVGEAARLRGRLKQIAVYMGWDRSDAWKVETARHVAQNALDESPPVPRSEPVVEGEPPLPVPSEELLRAQAIEDYLADARIPRPFPATQPEPSQETKGEDR